MRTTFESPEVRQAAADGRITSREADRIVSAYQLAGTINPTNGWAIERDVDKLERGETGTRVSKKAMAKLLGNIPGVQFLSGPV